jgi:putative ABC transport system permease protein
MFATLTIVGARYFATLGLPVIAGRDFTDAEARDAMAPVAIVDRTLAERQFGTANPIGRIVHTMNWDNSPAESLQIVGVVPTVRDDIMEAPDRAHLYLPFGRHYRSQMTVHARVAPGTEARMLAAVREAVHGVDQRLPILSMRTLTEHRDASGSLWAVALATRLFAAFGIIALVLATVGVYGLRAYLVARRTREIGIRIALGATHGGIIGQLLRESGRTTVAGLVAGLLLAAGLVQVLRQSGMLFEVSSLDPLAFTAAPLILAAVTMLASYLPARRALRIDPAVALRPE